MTDTETTSVVNDVPITNENNTDVPITDEDSTDALITDEESTTSHGCSCSPHNRRCDVILDALIVISLIMGIAAFIMFLAYEEAFQQILCPDSVTSTATYVGWIYGGSFLFIVLSIIFCSCFCLLLCSPECPFVNCARNLLVHDEDRPSSCLSFTVHTLLPFLLVLPLLVCILWLNFHGMNMIVLNPTDGAMYRCELDRENPDAHQIFFASNGEPTNNIDQECDFWPKTTLCEGSFAYRLYRFLPGVYVNGTEGAYRCLESSPEGHDVCVTFLRSTHVYTYIQTILAYVSIISLMILLTWVGIRNRPNDCVRCCRCCSFQGLSLRPVLRKGRHLVGELI